MGALQSYVAAVVSQGSHVGKVHQFLKLLESVFQIDETEYELEQQVKSTFLQVRGRIDTVIGDVLFEFKSNLVKELADAEEQLSKYLAVFHEKFANRPCLGIATDGLTFRVYRPVFLDGTPGLDLIERQDIRQLTEEAALLWLDRYLFRRAPKQPTEEDISARFGAGSPTYMLAMVALKEWWKRVKGESSVALKYELWQKQLTVVYGEGVGSEELFLQHSYLATVAKLLAAIAFRQPVQDVGAVLTGAHFQNIQIHNFVEEDLFYWPLHPAIHSEASRLAERLLEQLREYDPAGFNEDILKGLYQQLVDPQVRHDLGEYYTPDWLAELMLRTVLPEQPTIRVLDPACGSGTFLFLCIRLVIERLRAKGWPKGKILRHVEQSLFGVDVHPLAVLIARSNYLLACAPLLAARKGPFRIPVYLGDSLMYRSLVGTMEIPDIEIAADGKNLWFPERLRHDPSALDDVINKMVYWAGQGAVGEQGFKAELSKGGFDTREREGLQGTFAALRELTEQGRDAIWGYVVRNLVRPYILSRGEPFDLVIGNPPWLALRYIKSADYQTFVKNRMEAFHIKPKGAKLVTQLDLAALFFAECTYRYVREGGTIAFVMPRAALGGRQYERFMKFEFGGFAFLRGDEFMDLRDVKPLFNVPASVLICRREGGPGYPVPLLKLRGQLPRKNASWSEAEKVLQKEKGAWSPSKAAGQYSPYHDSFRQGATIVPRRFWFVRLLPDPVLGLDPAAPLVESDTKLPKPKKPWHTVSLKGPIEAEFLWGCVLPQDMLPFVPRRIRPIVLPIKKRSSGEIGFLDSAGALGRGYAHLGTWLKDVEVLWERHRTEKAPEKIADRLDYVHELSEQFPAKGRYLVLFTTSATYLTACVVDRDEPISFEAAEQTVEAQGVVADAGTYWLATDDEEEALFLVAWLNSPAVDRAIKPGQPWGLFGPRHIHKRPLEVPLPKYDASVADHRRLAKLGAEATEAAKAVAGSLPPLKSIATVRSYVRKGPAVSKLLGEIAKVTEKLVPDITGG